MQATTKSPSLEAHQSALKIIYSWTTPEQFDLAPTLLKEHRFEVLKPTQIATLLWVVENQRKLYANKPITTEEFTTPVTEQDKINAIADEYKEVDKEQFGAEEVVISAPKAEEITLSVAYTEEPLEIPTIVTPEFTPASETVDTPKRSRKAKTDTTQTSSWHYCPPNIQSVTVSRRVNLPIEWVQYSNNEFNVSVTASSRDDAVSELNELTTLFLADQWLVRKHMHDKVVADLRAQLKAEQEAKIAKTVQPAWDPDLLKRHEKLRDMMNFIYKNSTNKEEFVALKNQFNW